MTGLLNLLIVVFSFILILTYLYLRFKKRLYSIELTPEGLTEYYMYLFYLLIIAIFIVIILLSLEVYLRLKKNNKETSIFSRIGEKLQLILSKINIFKWLFNLIINALGEFGVVHTISLARTVLDFKHRTNLLLILGFITLPRLIIILVLILDIYIGCIHYYFYALYLIIIPMLFSLILYMLTDIGPRALLDLKRLVVQIDPKDAPTMLIETPTGVKEVKAIGFKLHPDYPNQNLDMIMYEYYYPMLFISGHMPDINRLTAKVKKYTLLGYYLCHCIGLIYILYFL